MASRDDDDSRASQPQGAIDANPANATSNAAPKRQPARWGDPLFKLDVAWTKFETWLAVIVLGLEIFALSIWVILKGMSTAPGTDSYAGTILRALLGALALGMGAFFLLKKQSLRVRRWSAIAGLVIGLVSAKAWVSFGVDYAANLLNWYQQASVLTLFGGLRGIGTRLTLLLALLGGSLATASGKHITIDFVTRMIPERARMPVVLTGWLGTAIICSAASWGFFDHISIENFGARREDTASQKAHKVVEELGEHFFIVRSQLSLDWKSAPHIFKGENYAQWLNGVEWNQWIDDRGFAARYGAEAAKVLKIPDDMTRSPMVAIPERGEPRGELINSANLVFPFGLLVIALRFILRSLLALSGHVSVDPDEGGEFTSDQSDAAEAAAR